MEITLRQLNYYVKLYELKSYTAAAHALGITQPALSISVSQMENALRVPLVERATQPIGFTEFGEILFRYAVQVLRDIDHARHDIAALSSGRLGKLDLAIGPSAAGFRVGRVLAQMCEDYPQLEICVQTGVMQKIAPGLQSGEFSLFLGTIGREGVPETLSSESLSQITLVPVCGSEHPLASFDEVRIADLVEYPWIAIGKIDDNVPGWRDAFSRAGVRAPRLALEVRNLSLLRDLLIEGDFITILPEAMVAAEVKGGILSILCPNLLAWNLPLELVSRADTTLPSAAKIFAERLRASFQASDDKDY